MLGTEREETSNQICMPVTEQSCLPIVCKESKIKLNRTKFGSCVLLIFIILLILRVPAMLIASLWLTNLLMGFWEESNLETKLWLTNLANFHLQNFLGFYACRGKLSSPSLRLVFVQKAYYRK